jgi:hypothetical protein
VRLLIGHTDRSSHLLLSQAEQDPALAHPGPDVAIDVLWPGSAYPLLGWHDASIGAMTGREHPVARTASDLSRHSRSHPINWNIDSA